MTRIRCNHLFTFVVLAWCLLSSLNAQDTQPPRGLMPNTDQLSSSIDNIDVVSGKLHLQIPLASLPKGNGGLGFDLNLEYDSNLYDNAARTAYWWQYTPQIPFAQTRNGGWTYNSGNYQLYLEGLSPECVDLDGVRGNYVRLNLILPDGSSHVLHWGADEDGKSGRSPDGKDTTCDHRPAISGLITYYTADGSFLKAETTANQSNWYLQDWNLYYPDGRHVFLSPTTGTTKLYDANENWISIKNACYDPYPGDCSLPYAEIKDSSLGRTITVKYNVTDALMPSGWIRDNITAPGPNGDITTSVDWRPMTIVASYAGSSDTDPPVTVGPFNFYVPRYIQLPLASAVVLGSEPPKWNSYAFDYRDNSDGNHRGYGELKYIRTPSGSEYTYNYLYTNFAQSDRQNVYPDHFYHNAITDKYITHDGITDLHWSFSYPDLGTTTITNPDGGQVVNLYRDKMVPSDWSSGLVYSIENKSNTGTRLSLRTRTWAQNIVSDLSSASSKTTPKNPYIQRETVTVGGSVPKTSVVNYTYDVNGNMLSKAEYDWNETGGALLRSTTSEYFIKDFASNGYLNAYWKPHNPAIWNTSPSWTRRLNAVQRVTISSGSAPVAATEYGYDDPYTKGNMLSEYRWDNVKAGSLPSLGGLTSSNSQVLTRTYDARGNLTDVYEPEVRTHTTYDSFGNVSQVYKGYGSAAQRATQFSWNSTGVALISKTDVDNNNQITYTYDNIGRQRSADEGGLRKSVTTYEDANRTVGVANDLRAYMDGKLQSITSYDQLGRVVLQQRNDGIKVQTSYVNQPGGARVITSTPYRNTSDTTLEWKCTQNDTAGRVTAVAMFKGSAAPTDCASTANRTGVTQTGYDADWTIVTDPAGKSRKIRNDGLGRIVEIVEDPSGLNYSTTYTYDALDNLRTVTQGTQSPRVFNYSSLGRLTSASNPESGSTLYTYYDSGDLKRRTDARGVWVESSYDSLHRMLTKTYSAGTPAVSYGYHLAGSSSAPNIGRLKSVSSSVASTTYSYNPLGNISGSIQTIAGYTGNLAFSYNWHLNGGLKSILYPSGRLVSYDVDDAGRTNKVYAPSKTYADLTAAAGITNPFTADGRVAQMKLGNGLFESREYNTPGTTTRLKLGTALGGGNRAQLEFNYSATQNNGNLVSQAVLRPGGSWTQSFAYDGLNRLSAASETGGFSQVYGYDRWGNRYVPSSSGLAHTDSHEPTAQANFDANNQLRSSGTIQYDAAGNQTSYGLFTLGYDAENRNTTMTSSGSGSGAYSYDGDGRRVKKVWTSGGTTNTTYYAYDALGQLAVEYSNQAPTITGTSWMFADMLGSIRTITSDSGAVTECYDYLPFGRMLSASDNGRSSIGCHPADPDNQLATGSPQKFTGKERDTETGLDFFGARYMSAAQGRFMIPDPSSGGITPLDPQSWNKYSYVRNRPTRFVDSNGYWATEIHVQITTFALKDYVSSAELGALVKQQRIMDKYLNGPADQFMHAMSNGKAGESADVAKQKMQKFIVWNIQEAKANVKDGAFSDLSLGRLGSAIHTAQDSTCPVHMKGGVPIAWNGAISATSPSHLLGEDSPSDSWAAIGDAIRLTMAYFMRVNPIQAQLHGLTDDTFDAKARDAISLYIDWYQFDSGFDSATDREAARQCALNGGAGAACVR
jgi:RHS repeat-associated protein